MRPGLSALLLALVACIAVLRPAAAQDLAEARRVLRAGEAGTALALVEKHLAGRPEDAEGRFLKGVILAEMNRPNEALDVFFGLTRDNPELPEPYNNLGVIYAARGDYERARSALEMAVLAKPDYAVAYENLGDVYAQLSLRAYERAAQLDGARPPTKAKLALARELAGYSPRVPKPPAPPAR